MGEGVAQADAVLLGRNTYEEFSKSWPLEGTSSPMAAFLNGSPKYVVSSTLAQLEWGPAERLEGDLAAAVSRLKSQPGKNIQIPGSPRLVASLLALGLLDELNLNLAPEVVGHGRRLFDGVEVSATLKLVDAIKYQTGLVGLTYVRV